MNLAFFIHKDSSKKGVTFKQIMNKNFKKSEIEIFQAFHKFKLKLEEVADYNNEIFILFADSKKRLDRLINLLDLFENRRVILILPDDSQDTITTAHQISPRYFTFADNNYSDLCAVITKMMNKKNNISRGGNHGK
ncbi:MAG: hypothetical protein GY857_07480 [Desulfobacula sp.]|nr:hypothetical protein [Desulfobacula sp.]